MKTTTKRMMIAIFALIFATTATSCKKEETILPENNGNTTPAVSMKPKSIITTQDGVAGIFRTQTYEYDAQNKLVKFISTSGSTKDSVTMFRSGFSALRKVNGALRSKENLRFNDDKSLKDLSVSPSSGASTVLLPTFVALPNSPSTLVRLADANISLGFSYRDDNLNSINLSGESVEYSYYNNLPFQKGINELQVESTALLYHKLVEQEDMTSYSLFSKLLHTVTAKDGNTIRRVDTYTYVRDEHGRIITIIMDVVRPTSGAAPQRFQSTITY